MRARDNPYTVQRVHDLSYRFRQDQWVELLRRLEDLSYRAAIVGDHGCGKSTLMKEIGWRLGDLGWRIRQGNLRDGERSLPRALRQRLVEGLTDRDIILLDGADELGFGTWWSFRRALRGAGGLLITSHRTGLLPTLRHCTTTPELLAELVGELYPSSACAQPEVGELFDRHSGNLREALWELYDVHALGEGRKQDTRVFHSRDAAKIGSSGRGLRIILAHWRRGRRLCADETASSSGACGNSASSSAPLPSACRRRARATLA